MKELKRIYHTWDKWECYPAGFYENHPPKGIDKEEAVLIYRDFLSDLALFEKYLKQVITKWKFSCEHYLTNDRMNRIAWLGQASVCIYKSIPSKFRGGYNMLSEDQQKEADKLALKYMNIWFKNNGYEQLTMDQVQSKTEANLY